MILSILIPTTSDRSAQTKELNNELFDQAKGLYPQSEVLGFTLNPDPIPFAGTVWGWSIGPVECIICEDDKQISVGKKRDYLYQMAHGEYSVQWDSDDFIYADGLQLIMEALQSKPDCVTYREHVLIDGTYYSSNHSIRYLDWEGDGHAILDDGFTYHRTPFMKSVIYTEYCRHIGVADMRFGEDHDFARLIKPMLLKEVHIDEEIYLYRHQSSDHNKRYGII